MRSNVVQRSSYRSYKDDLRKDFNARCGYCDSSDEYFGGRSGAHIDHFAPKSKFPDLQNSYKNLIYSCPFCNRAKSNKWISDDPARSHDGTNGFVDPCDGDFDSHFVRRRSGEIVATSKLGEYMIDHLKLRLVRHMYIWQADRLDKLLSRLVELRKHVPSSNPRHIELLTAMADMIEDYQKYRRRIYAE